MRGELLSSLCMMVFSIPLMHAFPIYQSVRGRVILEASKRKMTTNPSPRICLNHAGASPSSQSVVDRVLEHLKLEQIVGGYAAAGEVAEELDGVYDSISHLIRARSKVEVALVESATVAWTRAFYSMVERQLKKKGQNDVGVILISEAEYAANVVAASQWARDHNWMILPIPSTRNEFGVSTGIVDLKALQSMLSGTYEYRIGDESFLLDPKRIAVACITHVPTNSGIVNPVPEIGKLLQEYNLKHGLVSEPEILYLVDACQSVGQLGVDVQHNLCHALVATGRKYLRGPRGTGFLYISSSIQPELWPSHVDHYGVPISKVPKYKDGDTVEKILEYRPRDGASRFEFWESNISNRLGLGVAIRECIAAGIESIEESCSALSLEVRKELQRIPSVTVHHSLTSQCGIVSFYSSAIDSASIVAALQRKGFELSVVPATSTPIDSAKSRVPDLVRASVSYVTTREEVDQFIESLKSIIIHQN